MLPVVSIVGRPNVGKSTLFNRLTRSQDALIHDVPGVTRDSLYGVADIDDRRFLVVDTGGVGEDDDYLSQLVSEQVEVVVEGSDAIILLADATQGLMPADHQIAQQLKKTQLPIFIAVNKSEGIPTQMAAVDFHTLGYSDPIPISARRGNGVEKLIKDIIQSFPHQEDDLWLDPGPKVAIVGRPNVGKSTLINSLCDDERLIVSEIPGTTRDSVSVPLEFKNERYRFIDTAGVRRRSRVDDSLEKLSVVKTLQSIEAARVVVLLMDGSEPIAGQDATIAGLIRRASRPIVIGVNKADQISTDDFKKINQMLERKLAFAPHHEAVLLSGLKKTGIGKLMNAVNKANRSAMIEMPTPELTKSLHSAVAWQPPPLSKGRPIKLKYAHQGGRNPPVVVIHGTNVGTVPANYKRFLENFFRKKFDLFGTEVRVVFRAGKNPFNSTRN